MNTKLLLAPALVASSLGLGACAQNYAVEGAAAGAAAGAGLSALLGEDLGDLSSISNPETIQPIVDLQKEKS